MPLGIAAALIQVAVIGYLYPFFKQGGNPVTQGVKFSLVIGLMSYASMGFATATKFQIEPVSQFLIDYTIFQTVQFIRTGIALGLVYRK